jgi:hypothetical protein
LYDGKSSTDKAQDCGPEGRRLEAEEAQEVNFKWQAEWNCGSGDTRGRFLVESGVVWSQGGLNLGLSRALEMEEDLENEGD